MIKINCTCFFVLILLWLVGSLKSHMWLACYVCWTALAYGITFISCIKQRPVSTDVPCICPISSQAHLERNRDWRFTATREKCSREVVSNRGQKESPQALGPWPRALVNSDPSWSDSRKVPAVQGLVRASGRCPGTLPTVPCAQARTVLAQHWLLWPRAIQLPSASCHLTWLFFFNFLSHLEPCKIMGGRQNDKGNHHVLQFLQSLSGYLRE